MTEKFTFQLNKYDISARDYGVLLTTYNDPNLTQKEIGARMHVDRTTMVQLIDALESKKLLSRASNPNDCRQNFTNLTEDGGKILSEMWGVLKVCELSALEVIPDYQRKAILEIANKLEEIK